MNRLMTELRERMGGNDCVEMRDTVRYMVEAKQKEKPTVIDGYGEDYQTL